MNGHGLTLAMLTHPQSVPRWPHLDERDSCSLTPFAACPHHHQHRRPLITSPQSAPSRAKRAAGPGAGPHPSRVRAGAFHHPTSRPMRFGSLPHDETVQLAVGVSPQPAPAAGNTTRSRRCKVGAATRAARGRIDTACPTPHRWCSQPRGQTAEETPRPPFRRASVPCLASSARGRAPPISPSRAGGSLALGRAGWRRARPCSPARRRACPRPRRSCSRGSCSPRRSAGSRARCGAGSR